MKKKKPTETQYPKDELRPEYDFDYQKAQPNRFASRIKDEPVIVILEPDVAQVFKDSNSVNAVLRSLIKTMPQS